MSTAAGYESNEDFLVAVSMRLEEMRFRACREIHFSSQLRNHFVFAARCTPHAAWRTAKVSGMN